MHTVFPHRASNFSIFSVVTVFQFIIFEDVFFGGDYCCSVIQNSSMFFASISKHVCGADLVTVQDVHHF